MNSAVLTRLLATRPFWPFRICMSDGDHIDIYHPELVIPVKTTALLVQRTPSGALTERLTTISMIHVTRVEPIDVPT